MAKADLIIHPARLRIIQEFRPAGRLTAQELAGRLVDIPRASLYRHLAALVRGGILTIAAERPVRAVQERLYALVEGAANVGPADYDSQDPAEHLRYFTTFLGLVRGDFQRYLEGRPHPDLPADGVAYYQIPLNLSDAEYRAMVRDVTAILKPLLLLMPTPARRRRLLTLLTMPGPDPRQLPTPHFSQSPEPDGRR